MNPLKKYLRSSPVVLCLLAVFALLTTGCQQPKYAVQRIPNTDIAALNADDVVNVMLKAGFQEQQILEQGADLRNALSATGAAQVRHGKKIEAMFSVDPPFLYAASLNRGCFIYDLRTRQFK